MRTRLFHFLSATSAMLALCCSCVEEIEPSGTLDEPQPLVFTAEHLGGGNGLIPSTRAAADGAWDGDGKEYVAIQIGSVVKKYKVTSSGGALEPYDSDNTFYRTDKSDIAITAWYPYSSSKPSAPDIPTDQSTKAKREVGNLMYASGTASFGASTTLSFRHQTARVRVEVIGETGSVVSNATVKILGITAYNEGGGSYSALVLPQNLNADSEFITITIDSATYLYKLAGTTTFSAGSSYAYSLTLQSPDNTDYFYVEALASGVTVSMKSAGSYAPAISLLYSTDGSSWKTFTVGGTSVTLSKSGDKVWFKAADSGNAQLSSSTSAYNYFSFSGNVNVGGDLTSLLSADGGVENISSYGTYTFANLFQSATTLVSAEKLSLPSTTLASSCYQGMFNGCTSLTTAPSLPATTLVSSCYQEMFNGCEKLKPAPSLQATTLAASCYQGMFKGCKSLLAAPALSVETLVSSCYKEMFRDCINLTEAPALNSKTLASSCYSGMFWNCTSLPTAPSLPATTLATSCYEDMFRNCPLIKEAPALNATKLADYCYRYMFGGCGLATAPSLPAKTLASSCYESMFSYCTSLEEAPALPAEVLKVNCYHSMFAGCSKLKSAPVLSAKTLVEACYFNMFSYCTSLEEAPELPAETLGVRCYKWMFDGCTSLKKVTIKAKSIPSSSEALDLWLPEFSDEAANPTRTVYKSKNLSLTTGSTSGIPTGWKSENYDEPKGFYVEARASGVKVSMKSTGSSAPAISLLYSTDGSSWKTFTVGETSVTLSKSGDKVWFKAGSANKKIGHSDSSYNSFVFSGNVNVGGDITSLLSADGGIEDISNSSSYGTRTLANLFYSATTLVSAENLSLPSTTLKKACYSRMFYGCTSLTTAPKLPAETLATECYYYMFYGCTSLKPAPELPATTLAMSCYSSMFQNCTSLEESPVLPATELKSSCYRQIFYGCSNLSKVTIKAETKPSSFSSSFPLLSWLAGVNNSGTIYFTNKTFINDLTAGSEGGIPSGWSTSQLAD